MLNIVLVFLTISLIFLIINSNQTERFDLGVDLKQLPYIGKYIDTYEIGGVCTKNQYDCKNACNMMESCKGVSYDTKRNLCILYNDVQYLEDDKKFKSWKKFNGYIY